PFFLLFMVNLGLNIYIVHQRDQTLVVDGRLSQARLVLSDLLAALIDQETGERGYIITRDEAFLAPYRSGQLNADARLKQLKDLLINQPIHLAAVDRLQSRITAWRQLGPEYELDAARSEEDGNVAAVVATRTGMALFDRVRLEIGELQTALISDVQLRDDRLWNLRRGLNAVGIVNVSVGLGLVVVAGWLAKRWITDPVIGLGRTVRSVADGQLGLSVVGVGPPEVVELGSDIEAMRTRLLAEIDDANSARVALTQRGIVLLALRDELAPGPLDFNDSLKFAFRYLPAEGIVAGDWFDVVDRGDGRVAVALMDVSGHGTEAAVFALKTKCLVLGALRNGLGPARSLEWLATQLGDTGESFVTGVIVDIDPSAGRIRYASAGHPPMLM
ncbi:MAG: PP2C family protein-serine/threonine phosphatase, partial [Pseudonocardiaceae bacterium]